jgi:peptidoglycan/LPS O-acetylase OafA/YrhL
VNELSVNNKSANYIPEIDGLRALAVLAVLIFHFNKVYLPYGFLGVDIFFVISGYVISKAIINRIEAGSFTINDFFMRRFHRLAPVLIVVVTLTSFASLFLLPNNATFKTGAAALFGISNIALWSISNDYFGADSLVNANLHTWSLGVEEQFYLIFPFLLLIIKNHRVLAIVIGGFAIISLLGYIGLWSDHKSSVFYLMPFRFWELALGVLVYLSHHFDYCVLPKNTFVSNVIKYTLLCSLISIFFSKGYMTESYATLFCVMLAGCIIYFTRGDRRNYFLSNYVSVFIGKISYSLYLWHWPVLVYATLLFSQELVTPVYVVLTVFMSITSYYIVERPYRYRKFKFCKEQFVLIFIAYAAVASVLIGFQWAIKPALYLGPSEANEVQFLRKDKCHLPGKNGLSTCLRQSGTSKSLFLIGDSHAGNYSIALNSVGEKYGAKFQLLTGRALWKSLAGRCEESSNCQEGTFQQHAIRLKSVAKPGDIVLVSFAMDRFFGAEFNHRIFIDNFSDFLRNLKESKLNVILIEDIPKVCNNSLEYFQSLFDSDRCNISVQQSRFKRKKLTQIYNKMAVIHQLRILDPHDLLCDLKKDEKAQCSNMLKGKLIYLDKSPHLTFSASLSLDGFFDETLREYLTLP